MSVQLQLQQLVEGKIDFEGQKLTDLITRYVLITTTAISFLAGVVTQSLQTTFGIFSLGTIVLALIVVPPWPAFNRHPVKWLPVREESKKER